MPNAAKLQTKEDLLLLLRFAWNVIMTFKEDSGARISGWLLSFLGAWGGWGLGIPSHLYIGGRGLAWHVCHSHKDGRRYHLEQG